MGGHVNSWHYNCLNMYNVLKGKSMAESNVDPIWEQEYHAGKQLNRYPYDQLVTFIYKYYPRHKERADITICEIGFGAGNNLWFCAREGFKICGIEPSISALEYAKKRFAEEGLEGDLREGVSDALPFADGSIDIMINRLALPAVTYDVNNKTMAEIHRCLNKDGLFYNNMFADDSTLVGTKLPNGSYIDMEGWFEGNGLETFYSKQQMEDLYPEDKWQILNKIWTSMKDDVSSDCGMLNQWCFISKKL